MAGHKRGRHPLPLDHVVVGGGGVHHDAAAANYNDPYHGTFEKRRVLMRSSLSSSGFGDSFREMQRHLQGVDDTAANGRSLHHNFVASPQRSIATKSGKPLTTVVLITKRIVFRLAGDAAKFPTFLLGALLRSANFISASETPGVGAMPLAWRHDASFQLTRKWSLDRIFNDMKLVCVPALIVLGELLLVMLKCQIIQGTIELQRLEMLVEPFWLQETETDASPWQPIAKQNAAMISSDRDSCAQDGTMQEERARGKDFRTKVQALVLCEIFEEMEVLDNGYIEIAEVRLLSKCLPPNLMAHFAMPRLLDPLHVRERLTPEETAALSELLAKQQYIVFGAILTSLVHSDILDEALAEFDRRGCGEINFEGFWDLSESALRVSRKVFSSIHDEPRASGFCIRHGHIEIYAIDGICTQCAAEFCEVDAPQSPAAVATSPLTTLATKERDRGPSKSEIGQKAEAVEEEASEAPVLAKRKLDVLSCQGTSLVDASASLSQAGTTAPLDDCSVVTMALLAARQDSLGDGPLNNMLEKLEAAEWHILHRQESIGRASLHEPILSARKNSNSNSTRRTSATSNVSSMLVKSNTIAELTEFVNDAERRKRDGSVSGIRNHPKEKPQDNSTKDKKPKSKKVKKQTIKKSKIHMRKDKSAPELTTASSVSLSAMLREELRIATRERAAKAKDHGLSSTTKLRSHSLIDKVARVEDKRKKVMHDPNCFAESSGSDEIRGDMCIYCF
ncbi:hypothetical protein FI667_g12286, partial [Globisporangium splendens]